RVQLIGAALGLYIRGHDIAAVGGGEAGDIHPNLRDRFHGRLITDVEVVVVVDVHAVHEVPRVAATAGQDFGRARRVIHPHRDVGSRVPLGKTADIGRQSHQRGETPPRRGQVLDVAAL